MDEKRLGQVVQEARRANGYTQQALCQKSGLSYSTLAKIERGAIKSPSIFTIQHIASTLGISLDQLMQGVPSSDGKANSPKKVSQNGVRFVYFDMNGCLVRAATNKAFIALAEESGVSPDSIESTFWQYNSALCRGEMTSQDLNKILRAQLNILVDWDKSYLAAVEPTPGMNELVTWVASNYHIGIMTNTGENLVDPMRRNGTLPAVTYDAIIDSSVVHALKPEKRIYELAAEAAGLPTNELLLIDDDHINLSAAGELGWHTLSFDAYHPEASIEAIRAALAA